MSDNRITVLQQVKLVPGDNMMDSVAAYTVLTEIIEEGIRSTFGMRERDAIILRLAHDLLKALEQAAKSEELERKLKGLQLENGRLKKRLAVTEEQLDKFQSALAEQTVKGLRNEQDNQKSAEGRQDTGPTAEGA